MMNYCVWGYQDDYRYPPIPCGEPASTKIQGKWFCEKHADEITAPPEMTDAEGEGLLENMEEL